MLIGAIASLLLLAGIIWMAVITADPGDTLRAPGRRAAWAGLDPLRLSARIEDQLLSENSTLRRSDALAQLAAHHAHDMAIRGFDGPIDPEGRGLDGRRGDLQQAFAGRVVQWERLEDLPRARSEEQVARDLLDGDHAGELRAILAAGAWDRLGVAAAIEQQRCAVVLVLGRHWARLSDGGIRECADGGFELRGQLADPTGLVGLGARIRAPGGAWSAVSAARIDEEIGGSSFHIELDAVEPVGPAEYQLLRGGQLGLLRRWDG